MRKFLLLITLAIFSEHCFSQIGYAEFSNDSELSEWKNGVYENVSGSIINLGLKRGTYVVHWKFQVDSTFWSSPKVLHIANPIIDNVEVYQITRDSVFHRSSGEKVSLGSREFNITGNAVSIQKSADNTVEYYLKVSSSDQLLIPLSIEETGSLLNVEY